MTTVDIDPKYIQEPAWNETPGRYVTPGDIPLIVADHLEKMSNDLATARTKHCEVADTVEDELAWVLRVEAEVLRGNL